MNIKKQNYKYFIILIFLLFSNLKNTNLQCKSRTILFIGGSEKKDWWGGISKHELCLCKKLTECEYNLIITAPQESILDKHLDANNIKHIKLKKYVRKLDINYFNNDFYQELKTICLKEKPKIIYCNIAGDIKVAKKVAQLINAEVIFNYHGYSKTSRLKDQLGILDELKNIHIIPVSPEATNFLKEKNYQNLLGIKNIINLPPMYSDETLITNIGTEPIESKSYFFKKNFNVEIQENSPIVCCIANLAPAKNHEIILQAIHDLVYNHKIYVHSVFAGRCQPERLSLLKKLATTLKIDKYVHFLGFTSFVKEILYYSDIKVLASKQEPFGIALLEAALMKKPIILSSSADMANILIKHNETGLLFDCNNHKMLSLQIKSLLQNPTFAKILAESSNKFIIDNFLPEKIFIRYKNFLDQILRSCK